MLLLTTPTEAFDVVVPVLVLLASLLLAVQPLLTRRLQADEHQGPRRDPAWLYVALFFATVYGGYFGGALGVILVGVLGHRPAPPQARERAEVRAVGGHRHRHADRLRTVRPRSTGWSSPSPHRPAWSAASSAPASPPGSPRTPLRIFIVGFGVAVSIYLFAPHLSGRPPGARRLRRRPPRDADRRDGRPPPGAAGRSSRCPARPSWCSSARSAAPEAEGAVREIAPTVAFLVVVLLLPHLADNEGLFTWAAAVTARRAGSSARGPARPRRRPVGGGDGGAQPGRDRRPAHPGRHRHGPAHADGVAAARLRRRSPGELRVPAPAGVEPDQPARVRRDGAVVPALHRPDARALAGGGGRRVRRPALAVPRRAGEAGGRAGDDGAARCRWWRVVVVGLRRRRVRGRLAGRDLPRLARGDRRARPGGAAADPAHDPGAPTSSRPRTCRSRCSCSRLSVVVLARPAQRGRGVPAHRAPGRRLAAGAADRRRDLGGAGQPAEQPAGDARAAAGRSRSAARARCWRC